MASKQRARKSRGAIPFNALTWSQTIPFSDDLWLGMQARNLALVDMGFIRDVEQQALQEYIAEMRTPAMTLMFLSALSQMWIFAVYEFLRTWRERAKHLIKIADEYEKVLPRKRAKFMQAVIANAKGKENKIKIAMTFLSHYVSKIPDEAFMDNVRAYFKKNDGLFRQIEGLRVTLAKHQIPGAGV